MKTIGSLWKEYLDSWPEDQWFDDSDVTINGKPEGSVETIGDTVAVVFTCGLVFANEKDREGKPLTRHFSAWLKTKDTVSVVCDVPKEKLDDFMAAVKAFGVRVKK